MTRLTKTGLPYQKWVFLDGFGCLSVSCSPLPKEIESHAKLIPEGTGLTNKEWIQQDIKKQREVLNAADNGI